MNENVSAINRILGNFPLDFERAALVFNEENEVWANCHYLHNKGRLVYNIEPIENMNELSLESAFLWRVNGEKLKVVRSACGKVVTTTQISPPKQLEEMTY